MLAQPEDGRARPGSRSSGCPRRRRCRSGARATPTWTFASAQSMNSPFIQIVSVSRIKRSPLGVAARIVCRVLDDVHGPRPGEPDEVGGAGATARCRAEPAPTQTTSCASRLWSIRTRSTPRERERRDGARARSRSPPRPPPRARSAPSPRRPRARSCPGRRAGRPGRARAPAGSSQTTTIDLTIWSSGQPAARAASSAVAVSCAELLEPRLGAGLPEEGGDPLDRLGPGRVARGAYRVTSCGGPAASQRDEAGVVEAARADALDELGRRLGVDRERHQRLAALLRPRDGHVRDVHARLAEHRPDPADHAGDVVVAEEDHPRRELDVDREAERAGEEAAVLGPDRRPRDLDAVDADGDEVRCSRARRVERSSLTSIPRSAAITGALT